ncbi:MAG: TMEM165/GDT1 family protein [Thermodesulfobacteriota bacterium]
MDWKVFWVTFGTIFLAEMGDKTQLAALTMTAETRLPLPVFLGASLALCLVTLLGVAFGGLASQWLPEGLLKKIAGASFIIIGGLILWGKW